MIPEIRPASTRLRAWAMIVRGLGRDPDPAEPLAAFGMTRVLNLLIDLEIEFDIGLDVDETLPDGVVGGLLGLVLLRAQAHPQGASSGEACRLYDLAAERARRARTEVRA